METAKKGVIEKSPENIRKGFVRLGIIVPQSATGKFTALCPECSPGRKNALNRKQKCVSADASTGHFHCNHCEVFRGWATDFIDRETRYEEPKGRGGLLSDEVKKYWLDRGIQSSTLIHFHCRQRNIEGNFYTQFNTHKNGVWVHKYLKAHKPGLKPYQSSNSVPALFNRDILINQKITRLAIVEGQPDVLACYEAGIPAVTDRNGARTTFSGITADLDLIDGIDIVAFGDADQPGMDWLAKLKTIINPTKLYIANHPEGIKDANDYLKVFGRKEGIIKMKEAFNDAKRIRIGGIIRATEVENEILMRRRSGIEKSSPSHIPTLDGTFGWVRGWTYMFYGLANEGKSTFIYSTLIMIKAIVDGWKASIYSPEYRSAVVFYEKMLMHFLQKSIYKEDMYPASEDEMILALRFLHDHITLIRPEGEQKHSDVINRFLDVKLTTGLDISVVDTIGNTDIDLNKPQRGDFYVKGIVKESQDFARDYDVAALTINHAKGVDSVFDNQGEIKYRKRPHYSTGMKTGGKWGDDMDYVGLLWRPEYHINPSHPDVTLYAQKVREKEIIGNGVKATFTYHPEIKGFYGGGMNLIEQALQKAANKVPPASLIPYLDFRKSATEKLFDQEPFAPADSPTVSWDSLEDEEDLPF